MTVTSKHFEIRIAALIAVIVGLAFSWLSIGDVTHPLRPVLLVVGVATIFAAGWPLCVPAPDVGDDEHDGRWWRRGAVAAVVIGLGLGIGCAGYLLSR